jgi:hypothetical protein
MPRGRGRRATAGFSTTYLGHKRFGLLRSSSKYLRVETGGFWMTDGGALTGTTGVRMTGPAGITQKIDRIGKGPWNNVAGYRDPWARWKNLMANGIC